MPNTPIPPEARRHITGVFLLDKPFGLSSNAALQRVRRLFAARKAGHTGTLDPHATGLLAICLGEATKFSGWLLDAPKRYEARIRLGFTSTTGDGEGAIVPQCPFTGDEALLRSVLERFRGPLMQRPPMHSALKVDGKPLYRYAREGTTISREPRAIEVLEQRLLDWDGQTLTLDLTVSKGTYIRVLAEDIGTALGCGGYLSGLNRTGAGPFALSAATSLETLEGLSLHERDGLLQPVDALLQHMPRLALNPAHSADVQHGRTVMPGLEDAPGQRFRVYDPDACFLGVCEVTADQRLHPTRMMAEE